MHQAGAEAAMPEHDADDSTSSYLSLRQASALLGVHPSTLRRWADAGELPVTITPGGHRRFARTDLLRFTADRQRLRVLPGSERVWAQQALVRTRTALGHATTAHWQ